MRGWLLPPGAPETTESALWFSMELSRESFAGFVAMPKDLQELAGYMRQHYVEAGDWWDSKGLPGLQDQALPDDLLADFKQMASVDEGAAA